MNTKGTKFLAVLAVFAMMFAGFATVVASENFDAVDSEDTTIETNISEYTSQATVIIPKGSLDSDIEMLIKAQSTMPVSSNFEFTGHSYNNKVSGYGYNNAIYNGYAVVYLTLNLKDWVGSSTDKYIAFEQTNSALKGVVAGEEYQYKATADSTTMISYFNAKDYFNSAVNDDGKNHFAILVPQDGSKVEVTVTLYSNAELTEGAGTATLKGTEVTTRTFTLDFSEASTLVLMKSAMGSIGATALSVAAGQWYYDATDTTSNLTLNKFVGNVAFWNQKDTALNVILKGKSTLTADTPLNASGNGISGVISGYATNNGTGTGQLTIAAGETGASLNIYQLNKNGIGIWSAGAATIGGTDATKRTTISTVGGAMGIYVHSVKLTIQNADVTAIAAEKAINGDSSGDIDIKNSNVETTLFGEGTNGMGTDARFGMKVNVLTLDATSVLTTQGLYLQGTPANNGIIYVTGNYVQTDIDTYFGIAGLFVKTGVSVTAQASSSPSGGVEKNIYVVDGADAYGDNLTYAGKATPVNASSNVKTTTELLGKITTALSGDVVIKMGTENASIDLSILLKDAKMKAVKNIVFYTATGGSAFTLSTTEALDITDKTIAVQNGTFNGTVKNGSSSAVITGLKGQFTILPGSIVITGSMDGNAVIEVDGTYELEAEIAATADITFKKAEGATAALVYAPGNVTIKTDGTHNGSLSFMDVDVSIKGKVINAGTLSFKAGATLVDPLKVEGGSLSIVDAQTKAISLSGVTVTSALKTSGNVTTYGTAKTTFNGSVEVGGNLVISAKTEIAAGTATSLKKLTVNGDAEINADLKVNDYVTVTLNGASSVGEDAIVTLTGTSSKIVNKGTLTVNGEVTGKDVVNDSVLVIKGKVVNLTNNKTVRLYGIIGNSPSAGTLHNDGIVYVMDATAEIYATKTGTGTIDTSAVSEEVTLSGILKTDTTFTKYQIVTFIGNTTIRDTTDLTFQGTVVIPEGVTVTIEKGATMAVDSAFGKMTSNGIIVAEGAGSFSVTGGAEVTNNGTITLAYDATDAGVVLSIAAGSVFNNKGTIAIGEKSKLNNGAVILINTGDVVINGSFVNTTTNDVTGLLINKANVILTSEVNANLTVYNAAIGAKVTVVSSANNVTVDDSKIEGKTGFENGKNKIVIEKTTAGDTFGGFVITSILYKYDKDTTSTTLDISGLITVKSTKENPDNVDLKLTSGDYGRITVSDVLMLNDVDLYTTSAKTTLYVSGVLTIDDSCTCMTGETKNFTGILTVTGEVDSLIEFKAGKINAAMYIVPADVILKTDKTWVYTTVPAAVEGAIEAEVATVTVTGTVEIAEKVVVPAGMTLKIEGATVTIKEDIEVDIEADGTTFAVLNNTGKIVVDGKLVIDDVTKSKKGAGTIESEVVVKSGNTEIYTTLTWAMADVGTEEATITLGGSTFIKKNTVIPENITIDTNGNNFTVQNAELTIDGELYLNGGVYTVTGDNGKVIVNGCISKDSKMTYNGKEYPAGLYFSINDSAEYLITGIAKAEAAAAVADGTITYYGDLKVNSIDFDAEGTLVFDGKVEAKAMEIGSKAKVTFNKNVAIDLVTVGEATITFKDDARIDGTFVSPVGTIGFEDTYALEDSKITVAVKDTVTTMTLEGSIGNFLALDKYQVATLGDVIIKANLVELAVGLGDVTIGANVTVVFLEVYGDLVVDNGYKLTATTAYVYGSLTANAATDTKAKATAEISLLYAGVEFEDSLAAATVIAGEVNATTAIVAADATVPASISEMSYSTDVYAEGVKCLTAYASNSSTPLFTLIAAVDFDISDPNAGEPVWYDEDDVPVTVADIGDYDAIYGVWNYNVYSVTIVTDAGVKSVAINGIELVNIGGNVFVLGTDDDPLTPLKAGTYKVTYTLKTGYSGTAVLSTETGTILKDNSFVISPGSEIIDFNFQLAGTEPTPEPEPTPTPEEKSEWTITTILLCVLVVLIAIMAVIVALRLNRN